MNASANSTQMMPKEQEAYIEMNHEKSCRKATGTVKQYVAERDELRVGSASTSQRVVAGVNVVLELLLAVGDGRGATSVSSIHARMMSGRRRSWHVSSSSR